MAIKILTLDDWLKKFNLKQVTLKQFINTYKIRSERTILRTLKQHINEKRITNEEVKILYKHLVLGKELYLRNFYRYSLKINNDLNLDNIKPSLNNRKNSSYKNIIRNIYHKELLYNTVPDTYGAVGNVPFLKLLYRIFNEKMIDNKLVTPSGLEMLKRNLFSNVLSGFYFRASILNPAVIKTISKKYFKGSKVFTPTLGWSSYMYGFLSDEKIKEYVGTDVIKSVCSNTKKLAKKMFPDKYVDIYCSQSELLRKNKDFMKKYNNYFDVVFFSPPYYKLELYRGSKQSTTLYKTYEEWLEKYWEETIKLCKDVLHKDGKLIYIISGYDKQLDMNKDMNNITKKYFKYKTKKSLGNTNVNFTEHKDTNEIIYFFDLK